MKQGLAWRITLIVCVLLLMTVFLIPTFFLPPPTGGGEKPSGFLAALAGYRVNLGLDLMGGIHLTMEVETEKAVSASLAQMGQSLQSEANAKGFLMTRPALAGESLEFLLASADKASDFDEFLAKQFPEFKKSRVEPSTEGRLKYVLGMDSGYRSRLLDMTVDQALTTIRNRIDQFGVAEPDVRKEQGSNRIIIQLPGMSDPARAVDIIGKTAHLEFHLVREDVDPNTKVVPRGVLILPMDVKTRTGETIVEYIAVDEQVVLTGDLISNAAPAADQYNKPLVSLSFNRRGADLFEKLTGANVNKRLAIVLDGRVQSAPVIRARIAGGNASIEGNFTLNEATDLALVLRAGSLPAPVLVMEQRTVGPSLGQESIDNGIRAALIGGAAVVVFMLTYYGLSGLIANVMLVLDVGLLLAGMACFGATLTLPGIAGIVLTIGMAVDANVLIFERIREEMRAGMTPLAAIENGFSRASAAIIDSNVTTFISAVVLYIFGTGPIRGFAVTLGMGILASMFTAVFVSRVVYALWMGKPGRKLSI